MLVVPKFVGRFKHVLFDIEADGLLDTVTQAWCLTAYDLDTDELHTFSVADGDHWWEPALDLLENAKLHSTHNGYGFDYPLMKLLYGADYNIQPNQFRGNTDLEIYDTYLLSQIVDPEREEPRVAMNNLSTGKKQKIGRHSVESYGHQFGVLKREIEYWDEFSEKIIERCEYDTRIQARTHKYLVNKLAEQMRMVDPAAKVDPSCIFVPPSAKSFIAMEHCLAHHMQVQEENGIWVDQEKANENIAFLQNRVREIEAELEPLLPMMAEMVDTKKKGTQETDGVKQWKTAKGFSKTTREWFDPEKTELIKERGQKRKDGTKATRHYVFPPFPFDLEETIVGPYCRVGWFKLELSSASQVADFLLSQGWKPTEWNTKKVTPAEAKDPESPYYKQVPGKPARDKNGDEVYTSPKLTEDSFDTIKGNTGKLIAEHRTANHRIRFIQGILREVRPDGRVSQGAITHGAVTGRMQHRRIVNTPRPSSLYGAFCREIFVTKPPYWNFGADLSALEDRMKAHYISPFPGAKAYIDRLLDPDHDVHQNNAELWGVTRDEAKSPKYALDYNCGPTKLARTLGVPESEGKRLYDLYWEDNRPLYLFNKAVDEAFKKRKKETGRGWVKGLDGRVLYPRSPHAAGNMLFQSSGNIIAKTAVCILGAWAKKNKIDGWQWSFTHDEYQWAVHEKHIESFHWFDDKKEATEFWNNNNIPLKSYYYSKPSHVDGKYLVVKSPMCHAMVWAFVLAGRKYGLKVETTGECMVGKSWLHTH